MVQTHPSLVRRVNDAPVSVTSGISEGVNPGLLYEDQVVWGQVGAKDVVLGGLEFPGILLPNA